MFTGIVEAIGTVSSVARGSRSAEITIKTALTAEGTRVGDSVAVSGACLTVTRLLSDGFVADAMAETLERTTLAALAPGARVNLERALTLSSRLGGHLVSGHVDGVGTVERVTMDGIARVVSIACDPRLLKWVAEKGSVALDGTSLTVTAVGSSEFSVALIPHTARNTSLASLGVGDRINVECDLVAKYIERLAGLAGGPNAAKASLSEGFLRENGF